MNRFPRELGVMRIVGDALENVEDAVAIGICHWGSINESKRRLLSLPKRSRVVQYNSQDVLLNRPDILADKPSRNLEPHHTHFLLVDDGLYVRRKAEVSSVVLASGGNMLKCY